MIISDKFSALLTMLSAILNGFIESKIANPPDSNILDNWVFENFISVGEPFAKALRIFKTYVSVDNNLCGKLLN